MKESTESQDSKRSAMKKSIAILGLVLAAIGVIIAFQQLRVAFQQLRDTTSRDQLREQRDMNHQLLLIRGQMNNVYDRLVEINGHILELQNDLSKTVESTARHAIESKLADLDRQADALEDQLAGLRDEYNRMGGPTLPPAPTLVVYIPPPTPRPYHPLSTIQSTVAPSQPSSPSAPAIATFALPDVGLRSDGLPDIAWVEVPAGEFAMGRDNRKVTLPAFSISKYETTYAQYKAFLDALDGYRNPQWWNEPFKLAARENEPGTQRWPGDDRPAENVSWYDAMAFCRWLTTRLRASGELGEDREIRLPSEEEWEKAARGTDGRAWPWGNEFDSSKANTPEGGLGETTVVGSYPDGASPYGALDMSGNVWEWTLTEDVSSIGLLNIDVNDYATHVVRGGNWGYQVGGAAYSGRTTPLARGPDIGFRVVVSTPISSLLEFTR